MTVKLVHQLAYLVMEACIIGGVFFVLWAFHFRFLWARRWRIFLGSALVSAYALPLDAFAVAHHWGGFNPEYVSGIYLFGGSLLLEEIIFWLGTAIVTISAVMIFTELDRKGVRWWKLPAAVILPFELFNVPVENQIPPRENIPTRG